MERIIPMQHAYWNVTKHGSDVKTQACQSMSAPIPVDTPGAKAVDRMIMNIYSDVHKGSQMFLTHKDIEQYQDLEHYRKHASNNLTFRKCILKISKALLSASRGESSVVPVTPTQQRSVVPKTPASKNTVTVPRNKTAIKKETEDARIATPETGSSPKRSHLKRLLNPTDENDLAASKRFKSCCGKPVFRVNEEKGDVRGEGGQGRCIVCGCATNWYCAGCRIRCCLDRIQPENKENYFRDINTYKGSDGKDRHITCRNTCFLHCHPLFLGVSSYDSGE